MLDSVEDTAVVGNTTVRDDSDNADGGISGTDFQFEMLDTTGSAFSTYRPQQGQTAVPVAGNVAFTFAETPQKGSVHVVLTASPGRAGAVTVPISVNHFSFRIESY